MNPELSLLHSHSAQIGYGRLGVELNRAIGAAGVTVYDVLPGMDRVSHLNKGTRSGIAANVCWVTVPSHSLGWWEGQRPSVFTMWEATRLPESFRETLGEYATVIVPSEQNVEIFSKFHGDVRFVPLGIDTDQWRFVERTPPTSEFRFLIGGSGARKGTDLAVGAFKKVFPEGSWGDGPVPVLQMKSPRGREAHGKRVEVIGGRLPADAEVALYANAHVYLQPSRGEGFGLQPLQAIAQGLPTILTDAHGHKAFSHLGMRLSAKMVPSSYFIYGDAGEWWEPSLDELCDWMLYCYENYDQAAADAKVASDEARLTFTWANCAEQFIAALGGREALSVPGPGETSWHKLTQRLYRVVTRKNWKADICGIEHYFEAGKEHWETADVKRIMFEAGLLDPASLGDDDLGLSVDQVARLGLYRAQFGRCDRCGHQMNCEQCA